MIRKRSALLSLILLLSQGEGRASTEVISQLAQQGLQKIQDDLTNNPIAASVGGGAFGATATVGVTTGTALGATYIVSKVSKMLKKPTVWQLKLAISNGSSDTEIKKLINRMDKDKLNERSTFQSPLEVAIEKGRLEVVKALVDKGARIYRNGQEYSGGLIKVKNNMDFSVSYAVEQGQQEIFEYLMTLDKFKGEINNREIDFSTGRTPLEIAIDKKKPEMVKQILTYDNLEIDKRFASSIKTKLGVWEELSTEKKKEIEELLEKRIDPHAPSSPSKSPKESSQSKSENPASVSPQEKQVKLSFLKVLETRDPKQLKEFLEKDPQSKDLISKSKEGIRTPLGRALKGPQNEESKEFIGLLVEHGAQVGAHEVVVFIENPATDPKIRDFAIEHMAHQDRLFDFIINSSVSSLENKEKVLLLLSEKGKIQETPHEIKLKILEKFTKGILGGSSLEEWKSRFEEVKHYIEENPEKGIPLFHEAIASGHEEIVKSVFEAGVPIDGKLNGETGLHRASRSGHNSSHNKVISFLVEKGADLKAKTDDGGNTPLHLLAESGNIEAAKTLLDKDKTLIREVNNEGRTPRRKAIDKKQKKMKAFLEETAGIKLSFEEILTKRNSNKLIKFLETDPDYKDLRQLNKGSVTPLGRALSRHQDEKFIELLVDRGAKVSPYEAVTLIGGLGNSESDLKMQDFVIKNTDHLKNLFDFSITFSDSKVPLENKEKVLLLLSKEGKIQETPDEIKLKILEESMKDLPRRGSVLKKEDLEEWNHRFEKVKPYIQKNPTKGIPLFHEAIASGHEEIVKSVFEAGVPIDGKLNGETGLHRASRSSHNSSNNSTNSKVISFLVEKGADLKARTGEENSRQIGNTPLHLLARRNGNEEIAEILLEKDKSLIKEVNNKGRTPLQEAEKRKKGNMVQFLRGREPRSK